jgi:hypothetical protein
MRILPSVVATLLWCVSANAQPRELIISGIGANSCADVLDDYRQGPKAIGYLALTWAQGFWSSQNAMMLQAGVPMVKNLAIDSDVTLKALMDKCGREPSRDFGIIVRDHFFDLPAIRNPRAK